MVLEVVADDASMIISGFLQNAPLVNTVYSK